MIMRDTPDPSSVRFTGPLSPFAPGLAEALAARRYAPTSVVGLLRLTAHLSRWCDDVGVGPGDLTGPVVDRFLVARRASHTNGHGPRALTPILDHLRQAEVVPVAMAEPPSSAAEVLLERFARFLIVERALTGRVAVAYCRWVRPFAVSAVQLDERGPCPDLTAAVVTRFLTEQLPAMSRKSAQMTACALRLFLRFLHVEAIVDTDLTHAVPAVAYWRLAGLPKALAPHEIQALRLACDPSDPAGCRDVAVIGMLHRLGLRCAEAAALRLEDIDWAAGTIAVHGKGNRLDRLPLPVDVGEALVEYLRRGRPRTSARTVFVSARAPYGALDATGVSCIVARAARRAGLGTVHGHRLRHTAATSTLNAGASLEEVAQLLRHAGPTTTFSYAKTDQIRLARIARPWPTATGTS